MVKAILNAKSGTDRAHPSDLEVAYAQADFWAQHWFTPAEAKQWLDATDGSLDAQTAAALRDAGVGPAYAAIRLWYGRVHPGHRHAGPSPNASPPVI
jgi:hypothetical protein